MTKPVTPSAGQSSANVVEIDAIDVAEWERDQHTPQASSAGLAALVRQTLPHSIAAQPPQRPAPASEARPAQTPRPAAPPSRASTSPREFTVPAVPAMPAVPAVPAVKRAAPGAADRPVVPPRVSPAAGSDRPNAHDVVRQIAAQVRSAPPPASDTRRFRQSRVELPVSDDRDIAPLRVPLLANNDFSLAPPSMSPLANDDRDVALFRVSPFASTERLTSPPQVSAETVQMRWPKPPRAPTANPSPVPPSPVQLVQPTQPLQIETQRTRSASPDPTSTGKPLGRAASSPRMDSTASLPALSWIASRHGVMIGGVGLTVLLLVIAFAASRGSDPNMASAMSETPHQASSALSPSHKATRDGETPPPAARDTSAAGAAASTAPSPDSPAEPDASRPASTSPASSVSPGGPRKPAKIVALESATQEVPAGVDDDVPATARARAAYNEGNQALFLGNSDVAIRAYRQALSAAPTFPPGFRGLGLAYAQKGQNGLAIMSLRTYLTMAPHARDAALIKQRIAALMASDH